MAENATVPAYELSTAVLLYFMLLENGLWHHLLAFFMLFGITSNFNVNLG